MALVEAKEKRRAVPSAFAAREKNNKGRTCSSFRSHRTPARDWEGKGLRNIGALGYWPTNKTVESNKETHHLSTGGCSPSELLPLLEENHDRPVGDLDHRTQLQGRVHVSSPLQVYSISSFQNKTKHHLLLEAVWSPLSIGAIEWAPTSERFQEVYSVLFMVIRGLEAKSQPKGAEPVGERAEILHGVAFLFSPNRLSRKTS